MRRRTASAQRASERRTREDDAKRLQEVVPELNKLKFRIEEINKDKTSKLHEAEVVHTKYIVVPHAPAVFDLPCYDRHCNGGHDVTKDVISALQERRTRFEGRHRCGGESKHGDCHLELRFTAEAQYG